MNFTHPGHYAVVVGIDHYKEFRHLDHAVADADAIADWLADKGGVEHLKRVIQTAPEKPIEKDVYDAILAWRVHVSERVKTGALAWQSTRLYLYVSGHGYSPSGTDAALLTGEARDADLWHVSLAKLRQALNRSQDFHEVVVFADCCRDELRDAPETQGPRWRRAVNPRRGETRWLFWLAAAFNSKAYEATNGQSRGTDDDGHGHFTRALLEGLYGAAANGGVIDSNGLAIYVEARVPELLAAADAAAGRAADTCRSQRPVTSSSHQHPIMFWCAKGVRPPESQAGATHTVDIRGDESSTLAIFDLTGRLLSSAPARLVAQLGAGTYTVQCTGLRKLFTVDLIVPDLARTGTDGVLRVDFDRPASIAPVNGSVGSNETHQEAAHALAQPVPSIHAPPEVPNLAVIVRRRRGDADGPAVTINSVAVSGTLPLDGTRSHDGRFAGMSWIGTGNVLVRFPDDRRLPLWLSHAWITYVFTPADERGHASLDGASIHMRRRGDGLVAHREDPDTNALAEYTLLSLIHGAPAITTADLARLLDEKWANPMAGILGAHVLLLEDHLRDDLLDVVLTNLDRLVPGHPELLGIRAARLRRRVRHGVHTGPHGIDLTHASFALPTTWNAWDALLWLDYIYGGVIPRGTPAYTHAAATRRAGPWLAVQPEPAKSISFGTDLQPDFGERVSQRVRTWATEADTKDPVDIAVGTGLPVAVVERVLLSMR
ncbi:caspase family protein [Nannocystis sp.]|uniref:caspase family protein n=1 Tax=Nannocystis sp. TaxID=1962667 RepID=UPI0025DFE8AC|nr:caspase family protein [Nannocystis sp.]MBK7828413.1 hypothetical protein [Nannocystis sp.]